jgi:hypothetical protein
MGGFTLAGNTYVFISNVRNTDTICMCSGLYGFIDETDENIIFENKTLDIANIIDKLSIELQKCLYLLLKSHTNTNTCYKISQRNSFIVPSYWSLNKKLQM